MATVSAGRAGRESGRRGMRELASAAARWDSAEARADRLDRQSEEGHQRGAQRRAPRCGPGMRGENLRQTISTSDGRRPRAPLPRTTACGNCAASASMRARIARNFIQLQSEEVFDLRAGDQDRDAVGEADDDRPRNELDRRAHAGEAHDHQQDAGHHRAHEQAVDAVLGDDAGDHDDERAGRPADLRPRAAQRRDQKAGDDRAVDAGLRRESGGDGERHGQRQRDQADGDAGNQV